MPVDSVVLAEIEKLRRRSERAEARVKELEAECYRLRAEVSKETIAAGKQVAANLLLEARVKELEAENEAMRDHLAGKAVSREQMDAINDDRLVCKTHRGFYQLLTDSGDVECLLCLRARVKELEALLRESLRRDSEFSAGGNVLDHDRIEDVLENRPDE